MNPIPTMLKRLLDIAASLTVLVATAPILAAAAIGVRVLLGRPVLFRQERPGLRGQTFELVKLRTMTDARGPNHELLPDEDRMHWFGDLLRRSSIDELSSLLNILKGDMSLVGPRPLLPQYLARYSAEQARRHDVKPGLTGLAQISGRNMVDWKERMRLDVEYVDTQSLVNDFKILIGTVRAVLSRDGIYAEDGQVPREFGLSEEDGGR
ncbi:MAG: sugar transferase [Acidimicrobiales bacterium]